MIDFIDPCSPEGLEELRATNPRAAASWEAAFDTAAKRIAEKIDEDIIAEVLSNG